MYYSKDEEIIKDLEWKIRKLEREIEALEVENKRLQRQLDDANWRIRDELEPRIAREKRSYDIYVTSPELWSSSEGE